MKKKTKIIIGIVIGIILLGVSTALAEGLINSKDVIYQDNMSIGATDVQNAIDGTCSKIDKRLSAIEDKLYTITNISDRRVITTSTDLVYTGVTITLPAKSYCSLTVWQTHSGARPVSLLLASSATNKYDSIIENGYSDNYPIGRVSFTLSIYNEMSVTYYVWANSLLAGSTNYIQWDGFCATKV